VEGDHALEGRHFHFGKDAFPCEETPEVAATVGLMESALYISRRVRCDLAADSLSTFPLGTHQFVIQLEAQPETG
jgi:hypothetical protein